MNINYSDTILNYLSIQKLELMDEDKLNLILYHIRESEE